MLCTDNLHNNSNQNLDAPGIPAPYVIPAKAGIQTIRRRPWASALTGVTREHLHHMFNYFFNTR